MLKGLPHTSRISPRKAYACVPPLKLIRKGKAMPTYKQNMRLLRRGLHAAASQFITRNTPLFTLRAHEPDIDFVGFRMMIIMMSKMRPLRAFPGYSSARFWGLALARLYAMLRCRQSQWRFRLAAFQRLISIILRRAILLDEAMIDREDDDG